MGLAAIILTISTLRAKSSIKQYLSLKTNRKDLAQSVENLKSEVAHLEREINNIKSSTEYAKKILKGKYHLTAENEKILFFPDDLN